MCYVSDVVFHSVDSVDLLPVVYHQDDGRKSFDDEPEQMEKTSVVVQGTVAKTDLSE